MSESNRPTPAPQNREMSSCLEQSTRQGLWFKLGVTWLVMITIACFWLPGRTSQDLVSIAVMPQVPVEGKPIIATFKLVNPSFRSTSVSYQFYANGKLVEDGETRLAPGSSKAFAYLYENQIKLGDQVSFLVKTRSEEVTSEKAISVPQYPPQVWSSFVSFASFSTSVMGSMASTAYYESTFGADAVNVGSVVAMVLIALLAFRELTPRARSGDAKVATLVRLATRFNLVTWILIVIFLGLIYTRVMLILYF